MNNPNVYFNYFKSYLLEKSVVVLCRVFAEKVSEIQENLDEVKSFLIELLNIIEQKRFYDLRIEGLSLLRALILGAENF